VRIGVGGRGKRLCWTESLWEREEAFLTESFETTGKEKGELTWTAEGGPHSRGGGGRGVFLVDCGLVREGRGEVQGAGGLGGRRGPWGYNSNEKTGQNGGEKGRVLESRKGKVRVLPSGRENRE